PARCSPCASPSSSTGWPASARTFYAPAASDPPAVPETPHPGPIGVVVSVLTVLTAFRAHRATAVAASAVLALAAGGSASSKAGSADVADAQDDALKGATFIVSSKDFTESILLGKITGLVLSAHGATITDKTNIKGSVNTREALTSGQVDMYWEYT